VAWQCGSLIPQTCIAPCLRHISQHSATHGYCAKTESRRPDADFARVSRRVVGDTQTGIAAAGRSPTWWSRDAFRRAATSVSAVLCSAARYSSGSSSNISCSGDSRNRRSGRRLRAELRGHAVDSHAADRVFGHDPNDWRRGGSTTSAPRVLSVRRCWIDLGEDADATPQASPAPMSSPAGALSRLRRSGGTRAVLEALEDHAGAPTAGDQAHVRPHRS